MDASPSDALGPYHGIILQHVARLLGGAGPEGRRLAEDLVAAGAASSDAAFLPTRRRTSAAAGSTTPRAAAGAPTPRDT